MRPTLTLYALLFFLQSGLAQTTDSLKVYRSYSEAMFQPEKVVRLDLSDLNCDFDTLNLTPFKNLKYLRFHHDHLTRIPKCVFAVKSIQVLDLSDNEITSIPKGITRLSHLRELNLSGNKGFELTRNAKFLKRLPELEQVQLTNEQCLVRKMVKEKSTWELAENFTEKQAKQKSNEPENAMKEETNAINVSKFFLDTESENGFHWTHLTAKNDKAARKHFLFDRYSSTANEWFLNPNITEDEENGVYEYRCLFEPEGSERKTFNKHERRIPTEGYNNTGFGFWLHF